jgi:hypothetical protein
MSRAARQQLAVQMGAFLRFKRSLGYKYERAELWLKAFERFVRERSARGPTRLEDLARAWVARNEARKAVSVADEVSVLRQFFAYLRRSDPSAVVPGRDWAPQSCKSQFLPHILTAAYDLPNALVAVGEARAMTFPVYVLGPGFSESALDQLAQAGGTTSYYPASPPDGIEQALAPTSRTVRTCTFFLPGLVDWGHGVGQACPVPSFDGRECYGMGTSEGKTP